MQQPLSIVRGTTKAITITVYEDDGSVYTLDEGEKIKFGVSKHPGSDCVISKEMTSSDFDGEAYSLTITPSDTADLQFGHYYYDVGLQSGSSYINIIECSEFDITYNVTEWGGG